MSRNIFILAVAIAAAASSFQQPASAGMSAEQRARILAPTGDFTKPERWETLQGGSGTNRERVDGEAYSQPSANLDFETRSDFFVGNGIFRRLWVTAPSSTRAADGLGPLYNARACQRCHLKDGRGHPPEGHDDSAVSMLVKLSVPPQTPEQEELLQTRRINFVPEPTYGEQLQDLAVPGFHGEGRVEIDYQIQTVELAGGETAELRKPELHIRDLAYGGMHPSAMTSVRIAPPMIGLGLLEAVAPDDIIARADPEDADGDGISGKAQTVWSGVEKRLMLGRFGWKAGKPTIAEQSAGAMAGDIGISNPLAPSIWGDCTEAEADCRSAPHGDDDGTGEASKEMMDLVVFYSQHLAVPVRRDADDPEVLRGKSLFYGAGCIACHTPKHATRRDWPDKDLAGQLIWPYSDLLLHDMGEGLADGRPEGLATGREWRTPPLWGIGLTEAVNGHTYFLHDGRARNLTEAILWHGGEAEAARETFRTMPPADRAALLRFLESL